MKKKLAYALSILTVLGAFLWTAEENRQPVKTACMVARMETVQESIQCEGKVEEAGAREIALGKSILPEKIFVKKGDKVYKGYALMEYVELSLFDSLNGTGDLEDEALEAINALGGSSALQEYAGTLSAEQLEQISGFSTTAKTLTSPISGIVTRILATPNSKSAANDIVMVIAGSERLQVKLSVPENQISEIALGQRARVTGVGFQESSYAGVVTDIDDRAYSNALTGNTTPMVNVSVTVLNQNKDIKPGFSATVQIQTGEKTDTIVVPYEAVGADSSGREYVYVVRGGSAKKTFITTAMELGDGFEVTEGIQNGDQIVLNCGDISNGKRIQPLIVTDTEIEGTDHE